jgi:hypothetical protein
MSMMFFYFFKNYFLHQHIKTIQNVQTILNFSKKKISNFFGMQVEPRSQTLPKHSIRTQLVKYETVKEVWDYLQRLFIQSNFAKQYQLENDI